MTLSKKLGEWYEKEKRDLPWRKSSNPYNIWLSEIILQQTRVAQGLNYYLNFIEKFPDIFSLANADTEEVLKLWQGLGYYSRARNLHETARTIAFNMKGIFPQNYPGLLKLKGIGDYTAAAIASISFGKPVAAIDGNVKRVVSRLFAIEDEVNSTRGKDLIKTFSYEILDVSNPGRHNQAMMELGANICLPSKPKCMECPISQYCLALKENKVAELPLKYKKASPRNRYFTYLIIKKGNRILLKKRDKGDIWEGLYEFPLIENIQETSPSELASKIAGFLNVSDSQLNITKISETVIQKLSHQHISCRFIHLNFPGDFEISAGTGIEITTDEFEKFPVPRLIERYIDNKGL